MNINFELNNYTKETIDYFTKNKIILNKKYCKNTEKIILELYDDLLNAYNFVINTNNTNNTNNIKNNNIKKFYDINIKTIFKKKDIIKPKTFKDDSFPKDIINHIDIFSKNEIKYSFNIKERNYNVYFILERNYTKVFGSLCNKYIKLIIMWLFILNKYAPNQCANNLDIYIYLTSLKKTLPTNNLILDETNINSAFTSSCAKNAEIIIFREEEWFKVFIHESFHSFGLDFSNMNNSILNNKILQIFDVKSNVNLYEAYTEFWAEFINCLFCSFFIMINKQKTTDSKIFLEISKFLLNIEITYSIFQLTKVLNYMNLTYRDLYIDNQITKQKRNKLYREKTNILAYYVIKSILFFNIDNFLKWCRINNTINLLEFKKTNINQNNFYLFILDNYNNKNLLKNIEYMEKFYIMIKNKKYEEKNKNNININFLYNNLQMTICRI